MSDRSMPVPEGLAGMRVDAGLARLLGLSRSAAAALAEDGGVELDGVQAGKSDRLTGGAWLQVRLPEAPAPLENTPVDIEGMTILYSDDDIVAVDKPAAVAAHASVGWTGPTVLGGLAAAGYRITTSGVPERQGIVHRLDVGTSGVMVVALLRARVHGAQAGVQAAHRRQALPRAGAGTSGSVQRDDRRADRPAPRRRVEVRGHQRTAGTASPTTTPSKPSSPPACSTCTWKPVARTRSGCISPRCTTRAAATSSTAPTRSWRKGLGWNVNGCTRGRWRSPIRPTVGGWRSSAPTRPICSTRWTCCATRADHPRLAGLDEHPRGVRDEGPVGLDALVQFAQPLAIAVDREVRHRPNHLAQEVDDGADVEELDPQPLHAHVDDLQPGGLCLRALGVRVTLGPFLGLRTDEVLDQLGHGGGSDLLREVGAARAAAPGRSRSTAR